LRFEFPFRFPGHREVLMLNDKGVVEEQEERKEVAGI
jgi:hypothetical protein